MTQKKSSLPMENRPPFSPAGIQTKAPSFSFKDGMNVLSKRTIPSNVYRVGQNQAPAQSLAVGSAKASNVVQSPTSIVELARALKNDVDLIYQHVRNQIDYTPMQGLQKGSFGALADGLAGPFDQCQLMVDLLREAGHTADFVFGEIDLSNEEVSNWLGTDSSSIFNAAFLLAEAGIFNAPYDSGGGVFRNKISHIWVKVNIDGTDYHFDPSFKSYTETAGIDLATVMGYDQATLLSDAAAGATVDPSGNWVENVNKANIDSKLTDYSTNLINWIKTNNPTATFDEIVGGRTLDQETAQIRQTELPYLSAGTTPTIWTTIPDTFRIVVDISEPVSNINQTFFGDELYGKRLTVFFDQFNRPNLALDGVHIQGGGSVTQGTAINFTVHFVHPYPTTFFDEFVNVRLFAPYTAAQGGGRNYYTIGIMLGTPQKGLIDVQERELEENIANGGQDLDEDVLGVRLGILWNTFAAENARNADILGRMTKCAMVLHHWAGAVSFEDNRNAGIFDLSSGLRFSAVSVDGNPDNVKKFSGAWTIHGNSLERLALQQVSGNPDGFSGSSQLEVANADGTRIYRGTNANWATDVFPNLDTAGTYANGPNLNTVITPWLADGWIVLLPQEGDQTLGSIITDGWNFQHPNGGAAGFLVPNKGGIGPWDWADKCKCKECEKEESDPVGLRTGAYKYRQTDMTLGSSGYPYQLSFATEYSSSERFNNGPLGRGWRHNWTHESGEANEPFRGLGANSPTEASASIVQMFICIDLFNDPDPSIIRMMTTWLANAWWCDQMTNNVVSFDVLGGSAEFVKLPDGTFRPTTRTGATLDLVADEYIYTTKTKIKYTYGTDGNLKTIEHPEGVTITLNYTGGKLSSVSNGLGRTLSFTYSAEKLVSVSDGNGRSVSYSYDNDDQLVAITDLVGEDTTFSYADLGQVESYFLPENPTSPMVTNIYDSLGRIESQLDMFGKEQYFYFAGWRVEFVNVLGDSIIRLNDSSGNVIESIDELGFSTKFEYDSLRQLTKTTFPEGDSISHTHDEFGNVLTDTKSPKPGSTLADITTTRTYDPIYHKVDSVVNARGNTTTFTYDPSTGNLLNVVYPEIGGQTPTVDFTYNSRGQVLTKTDEIGKVTEFQYDAATEVVEAMIEDQGSGRLNLTTLLGYNAWGDATSITDPRGNNWSFTFDEKRRHTESVSPAPFNHVTEMVYDKNDNRTIVRHETGDAVNPWQEFVEEYNLANDLVKQIDPMGNETVLEYDDLHRLSRSTDPELRAHEFTYDARDNLLTVTDPASVVIETLSYTNNGLKADSTDANNNVTAFTYDAFDRADKVIYPDGTFEQKIQYNEADQVEVYQKRDGNTISYQYDELDRLLEKSPTGMPVVSYSYDLAGRVLTISTPVVVGDPSSGTFEFDYDTAGRIKSEKYPDSREFKYQVDEEGDITRLTYTDGYFVDREFDELGRLVDVKLNGETQSALHFDYDKLNRRTKLTYKNGNTVDYGHELNNNLNSMVHTFDGAPVTFNYAFNKAKQMISQSVTDAQFMWHPEQAETITYAVANNLNQYPQVKNKTFSYDANGNLTSNNDFTGFTYDTENQLVQAVKTGIQVDYLYDALHRNLRLRHDDNGVVEDEEYRYAGLHLLEEYENGTMKFRYIFGQTMDEPLIRIRISDNRHRYFHHDRLGSIIAHARANSVLARVYLYSPFGDSPSMGGTTFGFTGQRYDGQTRLHYYKTRFYDRKIGRFLQPDSIQSTHLYGYVSNDPLNFTDPFGQQQQAASLGYFEKKIKSSMGPDKFKYGCRSAMNFLLGDDSNADIFPEVGADCWFGGEAARQKAEKRRDELVSTGCCEHAIVFMKRGRLTTKKRPADGSKVDANSVAPVGSDNGNYSYYAADTCGANSRWTTAGGPPSAGHPDTTYSVPDGGLMKDKPDQGRIYCAKCVKEKDKKCPQN